MASGHVNRTQRPNTWLHRPRRQTVKIALANSEPSTHDPKRALRVTTRHNISDPNELGVFLKRASQTAWARWT